MPTTVSVRAAGEDDIPALLVLLLTSFRQFPLFSFLYAPLDEDIETARDTLFFWRRRLLLDLLDPSTDVTVAEISDDEGWKMPEQHLSKVEAQSWRMLDWLTRETNLSQSSTAPGKKIVGFAIWNHRTGYEVNDGNKFTTPVGVWTTLRIKALNIEKYLWSKFYQRRDQDPDRYAAYLKAEDELSRDFYAHSCYYLDNLCVDFRYQRLGIGRTLLEPSIEYAQHAGLPIQTEAGPMGLGLYQKLGFKQVGTWKVKLINSEQPEMELPVMRKEVSEAITKTVQST